MRKKGCVEETVAQLSEDLLSQAVMTVDNSRPTLAINLTGARQYWLEGMLRHEIDIHYLRGVNDARQPWQNAWCRCGTGCGRRTPQGAPDQPAQRDVPQAALPALRCAAPLPHAVVLLHAAPRSAHVLPPARPGHGALRAGRRRAPRALRARPARPDRILAASLFPAGPGVPGQHREHSATSPDHRFPAADLTGQGVLSLTLEILMLLPTVSLSLKLSEFPEDKRSLKSELLNDPRR
nr:uncharacterized protein KIAA0895-like isoform X2 [Macaca nemestrina]